MSFAHTFFYISHYKQIIVSILFPNEARLHVGSAGWYVTGTQTLEQWSIHIPHSMQLLHTILCEPHIVYTFLYILHAHNGMGNGTPNGLIVTIHTQREGQSSTVTRIPTGKFMMKCFDLALTPVAFLVQANMKIN